MITPEKLNEALALQKDTGGYLGEILVQEGFLKELDIVGALVVQCNLPYIAIDRYSVHESILKLIPREFALKEHLLPLDCVGNVLSVVMLNPLDALCKQELATMTKCRIAPFIATRHEIDSVLNRYFGNN